MTQPKKIRKKRPRVSVETQTDEETLIATTSTTLKSQSVSTQTEWMPSMTLKTLTSKKNDLSPRRVVVSKKPSKRFNQISSLSTIEETKSTLSKTLNSSCNTSSILSNKTIPKGKKTNELMPKLPTIESDDGKKSSKIPILVKGSTLIPEKLEKKVSSSSRPLLSKTMIERSKRLTEQLKSDLKALSSYEKSLKSSNDMNSLNSIGKKDSLKSLPTIRTSLTSLRSQKSLLLSKTSSLEISPRVASQITNTQKLSPRSISESFLVRRERIAQKLGLDRAKLSAKKPTLASVKQEKSSVEYDSLKRPSSIKKPLLKSVLKKCTSLESDCNRSLPQRQSTTSKKINPLKTQDSETSKSNHLKKDLNSHHIHFDMKPQRESQRRTHVFQQQPSRNLGLMNNSSSKRPQSDDANKRKLPPKTLLNISYNTRENIKRDLLRARKEIKNYPFHNVFVSNTINSHSDSSSSGIQSLSPSSFDTTRSFGSTGEINDLKQMKIQSANMHQKQQLALSHKINSQTKRQSQSKRHDTQLVVTSASNNIASKNCTRTRHHYQQQQQPPPPPLPPQSMHMNYGFFMYKKVTRQPDLRIF